MIPNKPVPNTPSELSAKCSPPFFKLSGRFNPSRAKATLIHGSRDRSASPSLVANIDLPPPGPAHYATRRALWLTPTKVPTHSPPSSSRQRLEHLLSEQDAVNSEEAWKDGVEKVWKGLVNGGRLKRSLPLSLMIKVIHAGWLRDPNTWPSGAIAPDSDQDPIDQPGLSCPVDMHSFPDNLFSRKGHSSSEERNQS